MAQLPQQSAGTNTTPHHAKRSNPITTSHTLSVIDFLKIQKKKSIVENTIGRYIPGNIDKVPQDLNAGLNFMKSGDPLFVKTMYFSFMTARMCFYIFYITNLQTLIAACFLAAAEYYLFSKVF